MALTHSFAKEIREMVQKLLSIELLSLFRYNAKYTVTIMSCKRGGAHVGMEIPKPVDVTLCIHPFMGLLI